MLIKKTFQGEIPENKILNMESNSQTDTYSCAEINKHNTYSSEEQWTGKYDYNGKKIYWKTIIVTSGFSTSMSIPHNISDLYEFTLVTGITRIGTSNYDYRPLPSIYNSDTQHNQGIYSIYDGKITYTMNSWWAARVTQIRITLEYTKTTD